MHADLETYGICLKIERDLTSSRAKRRLQVFGDLDQNRSPRSTRRFESAITHLGVLARAVYFLRSTFRLSHA